MNEIKVFPIGKIENENDETKIFLNPAYRAGLKGLGEYSHAQVLWWMDGCDNDKDRGTLVEKKPYAKGPEEIGVFALRSPERPNPIAVSNVNIVYVDESAGTIGLSYICLLYTSIESNLFIRYAINKFAGIDLTYDK